MCAFADAMRQGSWSDPDSMITGARLPDWPPVDGDAIGTERARAHVRSIAEHAPPLVDEAKRLISERYPGSERHVSSATVAQLATWGITERMPGLAVGHIWTHVQPGDWPACNY
jgi:hypothetical protein